MFHVKPFSPAPLASAARDVSRETFMRKMSGEQSAMSNESRKHLLTAEC
jgi:hypothetical protein